MTRRCEDLPMISSKAQALRLQACDASPAGALHSMEDRTAWCAGFLTAFRHGQNAFHTVQSMFA